jgi:hypothetical protein
MVYLTGISALEEDGKAVEPVRIHAPRRVEQAVTYLQVY